MRMQKLGKIVPELISFQLHMSLMQKIFDEGNDNERLKNNISTTVSEVDIERLPADPINSKIVYPRDHTPVRKVIL